jgi:hypothetical protein
LPTKRYFVGDPYADISDGISSAPALQRVVSSTTACVRAKATITRPDCFFASRRIVAKSSRWKGGLEQSAETGDYK